MARHTNASGPVDEHAVDELELYIDNDQRLHRQWKAIVLNLKKHQNKGRYDHERAIDGFMHLANAAAQSYAKEFGDGRKWSNMFSTNTRRALATTYVESFERGRRDEDKMLNPNGRRKARLSFAAGDKVKLRADALQQHARSVPARMGYTREQFAWRDTLKRIGDEVGVVERVFDSGYVNVEFPSAFIGIDSDQLMKVSENNPSQGWDVFLRGKKIDTVFYSGKNTAADIKRSLVDHDGYDPAITVRKSKMKANPGKRHMACGDLSKKRCDQLNEVYESARDRGYSKTRAAQQARGTVRKQLARDKRKKGSKKRRSNPSEWTAEETREFVRMSGYRACREAYAQGLSPQQRRARLKQRMNAHYSDSRAEYKRGWKECEAERSKASQNPKRRSNPSTTTATTAQIRALAARLVEGG
jgi:hypothetical protein